MEGESMYCMCTSTFPSACAHIFGSLMCDYKPVSFLWAAKVKGGLIKIILPPPF